jgi:hypothetical protein
VRKEGDALRAWITISLLMCFVFGLPCCAQADVGTSLAARLEVLLEDAERAAEAAEAAGADAAAAAASAHPLLAPAARAPAAGLSLPRRVALPWIAGACLCDYLLPGEAPSAASERAAELLGAPTGTGGEGEALLLEGEAAAPQQAPPKRAAAAHKGPAAAAGAAPGAADATAGGASGAAAAAGLGRWAAASSVALLAAAVGYMVVHDDDYFDLF